MPNVPDKRNRPWTPDRQVQQRAIDMSWFYQNYKWRKFSKAYKKRHPICVDCIDEGINTPTAVTDHLVRYRDGGKGFDLDNLRDEDFQPLCNSHHNAKSGKESHGYKKGMG